MRIPGTLKQLHEHCAALGRVPVSYRWDADGNLVELTTAALATGSGDSESADRGSKPAFKKKSAVASLYEPDKFVPQHGAN